MKRSTLLLFFIFCVLVAKSQDDKTYKNLSNRANNLFKEGNHKAAAEMLERAIAIKGDNAGYIEIYNAACVWAILGNHDNAFKHLNYLASVRKPDPEGYFGNSNQDPFEYLFEKDFKPLHKDPRWAQFIERLNNRRPMLVRQLDSIYLDDQQYRKKLNTVEAKYGLKSPQIAALWDTIRVKDSINLLKVKAIINKHGWPGIDSVGKRGNSTVFLVIQHADNKTQIEYLPIMQEAVKNRKARHQDLALLEDRIATNNGKKQKYGSQLGRQTSGAWYVLPLENVDSLDVWRKRMGLEPMRFYMKKWNLPWDVEAYKKQIAEIEKSKKN